MEEIIADSTAQDTEAQGWKSLIGKIAIPLITALGTILAAAIGVLPQIRNQDSATIADLRQKLSEYERQDGAMTKDSATAQPAKKLRIEGQVKTEDGKRAMSEVEVFLLSNDRIIPTYVTDVTGKFSFEVPEGRYTLLVRESSNGKSTRLMLREQGEETFPGAKIIYQVQK